MQSRSELKVGIEMRAMAGALTGVGNYSRNLLEALVSDYAYLQYAGFGLLSWKTVDAAALKRIEAANSSRAETKGFTADRIDSLRPGCSTSSARASSRSFTCLGPTIPSRPLSWCAAGGSRWRWRPLVGWAGGPGSGGGG